MEQIRLLLVEDHTLIRDGLKKILTLEEKFKIVGEAANGEEAVQLAQELYPDVILMDINMPVMNGIEASRHIKGLIPQAEIIALTIHDDEEYVFELVKAGISGYIMKDISADGLIDAVEKVASGGSVFNPAIAQKLLGEFRRLSQDGDEPPRLTTREMEVLEHVARGESNKQIADKLFISEKTVKNHLTNIFRKLDVEDRLQAMLYAVRHRLVKF